MSGDGYWDCDLEPDEWFVEYKDDPKKSGPVRKVKVRSGKKTPAGKKRKAGTSAPADWLEPKVYKGKSMHQEGRDLKATELEPGENRDIREECRGVRRFAWGNGSRSTYALALACCFYLNIDWVMCRFFLPELQRLQQADFRLEYDEATLQTAYVQCEAMFAREFTDFMAKLSAVEVDEA